MSAKTIELQKLSNSLQLTIKIIHSIYEKGESLRYTDIKKARIDAGMAEGSDTTVKRAFDEWQRIYGIQYKKFDSSDSVENLVKKAIESLRDELKKGYQHETEIKVAAADEEIDKIRTELNEIKRELEGKSTALISADERCESLLNNNETLRLELEHLREDKQQLTSEFGKATLTIANKDQYIKKMENDLVEAEKKYQGIRTDMEVQRQSQLKIIDDWKQESKQAVRKTDELRKVMQQQEQFHAATQKSLAVAQEKLTLLSSDKEQLIKEHKRELSDRDQQITKLDKSNNEFRERVKKLEIKLEKTEQFTLVETEALFTKFSQLMNEKLSKSESKKKGKSRA